MKIQFKPLLVLTLILAFLLNACVKEEFDQPEIPNPCNIKSGMTPNINIAGIKTLFDQLETIDGSTVKIFPDSNIVLEAKVISDDQAGNIYKALYLEDATGAVMLSIEGSNLFNDYPTGQTVHLNLSGLSIEFDDWVSILEIGMGTFIEDGSIKGIGRIPVTDLANFLKNNSCIAELTPKTVSFPIDPDNVGRLIKIENVQIVASDTTKTYANGNTNPPENASILLENCSGQTVILRNSGYASFANTLVPSGNGSITGIYTKYGNDYQILIRDLEDVDLNDERCGSGNSGNGSGTFEDPYDVASAITKNGTETGVWVTGYLVGVMETGSDPFLASLQAPFNTNSNVFIAPTANETDTAKMLIVKIGSDIRTATNLMDNESLLGSEIMYHGDLETYFSAPGLKNTNGYWLNGDGIDPDFEEPGTIWSENFNSDLGSFTGVNIFGAQVWEKKEFGGTNYAYMSGHDGSTNIINEDWLVSSPIDLSGKSDVKFNIYQAVNFLDSWDNLKIFATNNYSSDVNSTSWTEISINTKPSGSDWDFVQSEDVDFSEFDGQPSVVIAFKYVSATSGASAWEIGKVILKE